MGRHKRMLTHQASGRSEGQAAKLRLSLRKRPAAGRPRLQRRLSRGAAERRAGAAEVTRAAGRRCRQIKMGRGKAQGMPGIEALPC